VRPRVDILLCELSAHHLGGHYPHWVADVAGELDRLGHRTGVLTTRGWALGPDNTMPGARATGRLPLGWLAVVRVGEKAVALSRRWERHGAKQRIWALAEGMGIAIRQTTLVMATRWTARRWAATTVIMLSVDLDPLWAMVLCGSSQCWGAYQFYGPGHGLDRGTRRHTPALLIRVARRREAARRRRGMHVRVMVNNEAARRAWAEEYPWVETRVVPAAVASELEPDDRNQACTKLGLEPTRPIALLFGYAREEKDVITVFAAFGGPHAPGQLLAAGQLMGARFDEFRMRYPLLDVSAITVIDGYVDAAVKRWAHSAANYAVLSFSPGTPNDSGTLADAVSYHLPVCVSTPCNAADEVIRYGLGVTFESANMIALRQAIDRISRFEIGNEGRQRFLRDHSISTVTNGLLNAVTSGAHKGNPL
jgi:hypothetical protein